MSERWWTLASVVIGDVWCRQIVDKTTGVQENDQKARRILSSEAFHSLIDLSAGRPSIERERERAAFVHENVL